MSNLNFNITKIQESQRQLSILDDSNKQLMQQKQSGNDFKGSIKQQLDFASSLKPSGIDQYLPYDQLDLRNISNIKLTRTQDDDEFSQILKKERQVGAQGKQYDKKNNILEFNQKDQSIYSSVQGKTNDKSDQVHQHFRSILKETNLNQIQISTNQRATGNVYFEKNEEYDKQFKVESSQLQGMQDTFKSIAANKSKTPQLNCNNLTKVNPTNQQNVQNIYSIQNSSKLDTYIQAQDSSKGSSKGFYSPEFGNSELSFHKKKKNDQLKRNLFFNEQDIDNLTLEQFSSYQFQRNPFLSKDEIKYEQSSLIKKAIPLDKCETFQFLCQPCFETANVMSQDSISSLGNESTAKKKGNKLSTNEGNFMVNEIETTNKKKSPTNQNNLCNQNYFESIKSMRSKLPCFCKSGVLGYMQFYNKLLEIHFGKIVKENDVKNYFKYLVWKLSSEQRLSIESLFFHIEKRIYQTEILKFKPFIQQYLRYLKSESENKKISQNLNNLSNNEKSEIPKVLQQKIKEYSPFPNQVVLLIGEIIETNQLYLIELTDTWSSLYKVVYKQLYQQKYSNHLSSYRKTLSLNGHINEREEEIRNKHKMTNNQLFEDLLLRKQLKSQTKVRISNLSLSNEQKISVEIGNIKKEFGNLVYIHFNSFQREINQQTKLGYLNKPFLRTISSIKPFGGLIPTLDVVILKRYPLLVQYNPINSKKIITYSDAVSSSVVDRNKQNDFFFAKYIVSDSLYVYDKSLAISSQPLTELIIQFSEPSTYNNILEGQRIRIRNTTCDNVDIQEHYPSGYKITLRVLHQNIIHQERFLTKQDFAKSISFYDGAQKAFTQNKTIGDLPSCSNLNYLEALDFDIKISFRNFSQKNNSIIGEIKYFNEIYECEILSHNPLFKLKLLSVQSYQPINLSNVHFKSINTQKKKFIFKTSFNSFINV